MKIKRVFTCVNGHTYESKEPIITGWAEMNYPKIPFPLSLFRKQPKANDRCKFCMAQIVSEMDYVDGKNVMGAVLDPKYAR